MRLLSKIKLLPVAIIAAICCVSGGLCGCVLAETVEVVILYTPQMHTKFDVNKSLVEINNARVFTYSPLGVLLQDTLFTAAELTSGEPLQIIKGVNPGEYKMVAFYNVDQLIFTGNARDESQLEDLKVSLPDFTRGESPVVVTAIDSVCHSASSFVVSRGEPTILNTELNEAHYFVTVKVTGLERLTVPVGEVDVHLLGVPRSFGALCDVRDRMDIDVELEPISPDAYYGQCMSLMFHSADKAQLRVLENGTSIQTLLLEPERYFELGAPINRLNIEVQFYANSYVISVNNWRLGEFEIINVGG